MTHSEIDIISLLLQTNGRTYKQTCMILGNSFGYLVQFTLGLIAFSSLLYKRYVVPVHLRRSWLVWGSDVGKQAIGSMVAHGWNLLFAAMLTTHGANECIFYVVNFTVDSGIGVVFSWLLLRNIEALARAQGVTSLARSGYYGPDPERPQFKMFALQLGVWLWIITVVKVLLLYCVVIPFREPLYDAAEWVFTPLDPYPKEELVVVMVLIPLIGNVLMFWVTDQFLMAQTSSEAGNSLLTAKDPRQYIRDKVRGNTARVHASKTHPV